MHDLDNSGPDEIRAQDANQRKEDESSVPSPESLPSSSSPPSSSSLPAVLQNWHVIDGEATLLGVTVEDDPERKADGSPDGDSAQETTRPLHEQISEVVVLILHTRRLEVTPGGAAEFQAEIINNGDKPALFEVAVEGWVDEAWFPELPVRVTLQPGERKPVSLRAAPPRAAQPAAAGEHTVAVAAYASAYPNHSSRIRAMLVVAAYDEFGLDGLQPATLTSSYFKRTAHSALVLHNLGNRAAQFELAGRDRSGLCVFEFAVPGATQTRSGRAEVSIDPGQTQQVSVEVRTSGHALAGFGPKEIPFRVAVRRLVAAEDRRVADGRVTCAPLLGPWQLAVVASILILGLIGVGLAGLGILVALRQALTPVAAPAPVVAPAPVIALVLSMDQPVPERAADSQSPAVAGQANSETNAGAASAPLVLPEQVTAPGEPTRALAENVVLPDQVTAPGEPTRAVTSAQAAAPGIVQPQQSDSGRMTYGQMFREVGQRYDLSWPLLAAIAYVESGLDSLALGNDGTLGLMQIRPATWQEWAPVAEAGDPFDSYENVQVAAAYLDHLRNALGKEGYPQQEWMLIAYNWGPDKTIEFLNDGGGWDSLPAEVRNYATEVLRVAESIPAN